MSNALHVWEIAGLGKAPYKFIGVTESKFQAIPGDPSCPILPGSSCDFCPMGIMHCFWFRSADGKEFKVGCDCFYRANSDKSLKRQVDAAVAKRDKALREARTAKKAEKNKEEFSELLAELDGWSKLSGFVADFSASVARHIRKGKKPSPRQLEVIARLRQEVAA